MRYKSVLTIVSEPALAEQAIAVAARLAIANDGHLDVLVIGMDVTQPGYTYIGTGMVMADWSMQQAQEDAKAAEIAARAAIAQLAPGLRWSLDTAIAIGGQLTALIAQKAAYADLVVQPVNRSNGQREIVDAIIEAALFEGRAPVLIVPKEVDVEKAVSPRLIVLAWNQSAEALVAAKCALPLLQAAALVDVTVVDPPRAGAERSDPGGALCQFLSRHGVRAEVTVLTRSCPKISEVLAQHAVDRDADLMVMGAYGHSRLREAVLGGATREVLENTQFPVLMAH